MAFLLLHNYTDFIERKINNFINDNQIEVIDIKFSSSVFYFGVMIIYK